MRLLADAAIKKALLSIGALALGVGLVALAVDRTRSSSGAAVAGAGPATRVGSGSLQAPEEISDSSLRLGGRTASARVLIETEDGTSGDAPGGDSAWMSGRVVDATGVPVPDLALVLVDAHGGWLEVVSDGDGRFVRKYMPAEERRRLVSARSLSPEWVVERFLGSPSGEVLVRVRTPGCVRLNVFDGDGAAVPAFVATALRVDLRTRELREDMSFRGEHGHAELTLPVGTYYVLLTVPGRLPEWVADEASGGVRALQIDDGESVVLDHALAPAKEYVTLNVFGSAGSALAGVEIVPALTLGQLELSRDLAVETGRRGFVRLARPGSMRDLGLGMCFRFRHAELGESVRFVQYDESGAATVTLGRTSSRNSSEYGELRIAPRAGKITCTTLGPLELPVGSPRTLPEGESVFVHPGLYEIEGPSFGQTLLVHPGAVHVLPPGAAAEAARVTLVPDPGARYRAALSVTYRENGRTGVRRSAILASDPLTLECSAERSWELRIGGRLAPSKAFLPLMLEGRGADAPGVVDGRWQVPPTQRIHMRCEDSAGLPVAGLFLEVRRVGDQRGVELVSDEDGMAICFAVPGDYTILPAGAPGLASTNATLLPMLDAEVRLVVPREPAIIRGRIVGSESLPLPAAAIVLAPLAPAEGGLRRAMLLFVADDQGEFLTGPLAPGPYRMTAYRSVDALKDDQRLLAPEELSLLPGEERNLVLIANQ